MGLGTAFTVLAVLEAQDKMSKVIEKNDAILDTFTDTVRRAAESAAAAGAKIDSSLLQTASGADAVELADARLAAAQEKLAASTTAQANAEKALLDARASIASEDELAAAADALTAAQGRATEAATELATAQAGLKSATVAKASEDELAVATAAVTAAQERATIATTALTEAQERQSALVTPEDAAKAADALTAAQKRTAAATNEASAAEQQQAAVQRAAVLATDEGAAAADAEAAASARAAEQAKANAAAHEMASKAMTIGAIAVAAIGYESIKAAGNFQSLTEHLVTDAGESQSKLAMIRAGILNIAVATGTSTTDVANGMYHVESAGFHGAAAIKVMTVAAQGAKVGGADLDTVAQALTGSLNAFSKQGLTATQMMNGMIATVAAGDMKMQDLGSSLGNVASVAASAGLSYAQVGGAIATMTAQNITAQRATQDLAHTIGALGNPTAVMTQEMQAMGLNSNMVSKNLGKVGLTGTIQVLTQAIAAHTKGGQVLISTYNASAQASANANTMIKAMDPSMAKLAQQVLNGTISYNSYNTALKAMSPTQRSLMTQFEGVANKTKSFNSLLKSGSPAAQTFNAAMAKMTGGQTSLSTILAIGGGHLATFTNNVASVGKATSSTSKNVDNWSKVQGTFNQKMDVLKSSVEAAGISIGTALLPIVTKVASIIGAVVSPMATWISHNQKLVGLLAAVVGAIGLVVAAMKAWEIVQTVMDALALIFAGAEAAILSPAELIVIAIAAVAAAVYYAYTHFKSFRDVVNDVMKAVKTVVLAVVSAVVIAWHAVSSAAVAVGHALVSAWNGVVSAAESVWHAITSAWNAVASVTSTVWNAISGFFEKWWPLLLVIFAAPIAILLAVWNHFHQAIFDAAKTAWNAISSFFVGIWHGIVDYAEAYWNTVKLYIINPIKAVWAYLQPAIHTIESFLSSAWHSIESTVSSVWNSIKTSIIQPIESAWHTVASTISNIASSIWNGLVSAWHAVENVGSWFLSIGEGIVNGIISGVENAGSALFGSLKNLASGALSAAKSFLGIGSPSKLFRDEVGQWIPGGIAAGVTKYASVAQNAVKKLSTSLTGTAHTAVTGTVSMAATGSGLTAMGSGGGGGTTVIVNNNFAGAHIMSQADMARLASEVGKSITRALPGAGVHIRA